MSKTKRQKRTLISSKIGTGQPPPGMTKERWKKLGENCQRVERLTGIAPITGEGWEMCAVILMDMLEAKS